MLHFFHRCQCGWEKADHENTDKTSNNTKHEPWKTSDVKLCKTNAYGEVEFHGAGKSRTAKVTLNFSRSL